MHPYLKHLLQDIREAHRANHKERLGKKAAEERFREIDRWVSGDAEQTLGYYCGLQASGFPPAEQFSENEIQQVCRAFENMLASWGAVLDVPEILPLDKKYKFIVGLLHKGFTPVNSGTFVFDCCTGYAPDCELGTYCRCLEYWNNV